MPQTKLLASSPASVDLLVSCSANASSADHSLVFAWAALVRLKAFLAGVEEGRSRSRKLSVKQASAQRGSTAIPAATIAFKITAGVRVTVTVEP